MTTSVAPTKVTLSPEPIVKLENYFREPYNLSVATARTCYSSKIISTADVAKDEQAIEQRDRIAESIYKAGHHTTIQHPTFQFILDKVSRQFIWSFLHAHPYYNSEQVSQRYVEVKPEHCTVPPLEGEALELYQATIHAQMDAYHRLIELLAPAAQAEYQRLFPHRRLEEKRWASAVRKKQLEVARYVLPVATHAHLYHTVSGLTIYRYHRLSQQFDTPLETRIVIGKMVEQINQVDPGFSKLLEDPLPLEETLEYQIFAAAGEGPRHGAAQEFVEEFDESLEGYTSKLVDYKVNADQTMAQAVRAVLGWPSNRLTDDAAIDLVMNPAKNRYFSEALTLTTLSKLTRTMVHPHFTFRKRLSHTADSQDQRHRMTPASRPVLSRQVLGGRPDYITPTLIAQSPEALACYRETMQEVWRAIAQLLELGVSEEYAMYLLPNAVPVRFEESGDLLNLHHKWVQRLCYTAQEEIWRSCRDEVLQVRELFPSLAQAIQAPCWVRSQAGVKPFCPEGDRFCGVAVWKLPVESYERMI
ncbi:MAG: FAD-dependent thymidylate synthase [Candidatus Omnitrophica bacterium]|nr:FAD-dependent thymidylate synthase [Candidatus Omnitrophota bacterium]